MEFKSVAVWQDDIVLPVELIKGVRDILARAADRLEVHAKDDQDWEVIRELDEQKFLLGARCNEREVAR